MPRSWQSHALIPFLLMLASCGQGAPAGGAGGGFGGGPPPLVEAITVRAQDVPNIIELPGRIEAVRTAEVRARSDGIVQRRLFQEGTDVRAGQPLFQIDARDLTAVAAQARAALSRAEAARTNAAAVVRRYAPLVPERAISGQEFDAAKAALAQETANVADARAALARAQLALSYATVRAPIAGRAGRAQVTEGALVSAASATLLTTIEQPAPVYAVFSQSNAAMLDLRQSGGAGAAPLSQVAVRLELANGRDYGAAGRLDFADQVVDPQTGSQTLRAVFPNPARLLLPGQFVRGRIAVGNTSGVLLPARAIQFGQRGASVSIVAADGTVSARPVELAGQSGSGWVLKSGVKPGERVITDGWQKVQPGQKVQVKGDRPPAGQPGAAAGK